MKPAISIEDIYRVYPQAARDQVLLGAVVLNFGFHFALKYMHDHNVFTAHEITFKGGTGLRMFRFEEDGRFSFDLDFNIDGYLDAAVAHMRHAICGSPVANLHLEIVGDKRIQLQVTSDLLPEGRCLAKIDFSDRGQILPISHLTPLSNPYSDAPWFDPTMTIPMIDEEENLAEKLCRWQRRPLVRDIADLVRLRHRITDHDRIAEIYALVSYREWAKAEPEKRRGPTPFTPLEPTGRRTGANFALPGLCLPGAPNNKEKVALLDGWVREMRETFRRLDVRILQDDLQRFANATDDSLLPEAIERLAQIGAQATAESAPTTQPNP